MQELLNLIQAAQRESLEAIEAGNKEALADLYSVIEPIFKVAKEAREVANQGLKGLLEDEEIVGQWKKVVKHPYKGGAKSEEIARADFGDRFFETVLVFQHKDFREEGERTENRRILEAVEADQTDQAEIRRVGETALEESARRVVARLLEQPF